MKRWYVVHTHANGEQKARHHLERQGFSVYLPLYSRRISHARKVSWRPRPLFPRYLFVSLDLDAEPWRKIMSTIGVLYMICHQESPAPVPDGIVEEIRDAENATGQVSPGKRMKLSSGDTVQITAGAMVDRIGLFEGRTDDERVIVLLELMGRRVRTTVPVDTIEVFG
ncbi:MAG: Transcription antitermination protein RfaH [Alphaproteobacteria bacterium MarineAlpha11_Bin1]|nr:MAG: Transcription antitermination protein RfaH [Alphaproteobacteria bacterium MarineAlpha11_Bin1]|tara:strand:- start:5178 stop:5681 length:504 start_codon:yes stop_codon:yes gene_type:complete